MLGIYKSLKKLPYFVNLKDQEKCLRILENRDIGRYFLAPDTGDNEDIIRIYYKDNFGIPRYILVTDQSPETVLETLGGKPKIFTAAVPKDIIEKALKKFAEEEALAEHPKEEQSTLQFK